MTDTTDLTDPKPDQPAADPFATSNSEPTAASEPRFRARGGIGFFTATVMSTIAAVGGAYLALFVQSKPDLMVSTGIARLLPATKAEPAFDPAIMDRLVALETDLAALEALVGNRQPQALPNGTVAPPVAGPQPTPAPTPNDAPLATPPAKAPLNKAPAATAPNPSTTAPSTAPTTPAVITPPAVAAVPVPVPAAVATGPSATELAAIGGRVTAIETRLAALDPTGAGGAVIAGLQTEIATLKVIVAQLQSQITAAPPASLTMAVVALADAANRNGPFLSEFEAVRASLPTLPEATSLAALARTGAPSRALLVERFAGLAPAIAEMEAKAEDEGGLTGWFRSILANLIRVEEPATAQGNSANAILARAKIKLDQSDLAGAITDVSELAPQPDAVRAWLAGAKARLELEQKMAALRGAVESGAFARVDPPAAAPFTVPNAAPAPKAAAAPPVGVIPSTTASPPATGPAAGAPAPNAPAPNAPVTRDTAP